MNRIESELAERGLALPPVAAPAGAYVPALRVGDQVLTSGQLPFVDGALPKVGAVGGSVTAEEAYELAGVCVLNALAAVKSVIGDLDRIERIVKVTGFVNSTPDFTGQPGVVNGASELLGELFGEAGQHVRSAVGVVSLPKGTPVELELTVQVRAGE
ncbi:RidA family protein [Brevibacterium jeotgali]|uniref:Enamine deaminase RidA, house cleaning of reactive enamine intermediates, YjgF/YER057c/UK114 family n=1 Tax=Brevibacterium jeotgali TaxID=1262550 RepID=A0A2H1L1D1_9MICO|nr:RidA family protein [Brevibacterium jeotgali]TWC02010.1 enamine deaminase RidA (YjgF/YER057c/UK114 family) [Brevibacterium jeotgali]SMY10639.1 Enamine deaminase RidA, house cleaning of reactive enamine intermediates, YjgF/YER057c/UK114 family [Brevibacterium jeotgali]